MTKVALLCTAVFSLCIFCSKSDSESTTNNLTTSKGSIIYTDVVKDNGSLIKAVKVFNLSKKTETFFETDDFIYGGVSISQNGLIAQLFDRGRDEAIIRISKLDGTLVKQFVYPEEYSFSTSGARISPDGTLVAFALRVQVEAGISKERVYFCGTGENNDCYYYDNLGDPEWLPDGRLIAVNVYEDGTRGGLYATDTPLTVGNVTPANVKRIGPDTLDNARDPVVTSDGKTILLGLGTLQNIYAIDIESKQVKQITKEGIEQLKPIISDDSKTLFYIQQCCPQSSLASASGPTIHAIPLNLSTPTNTPISINFLSNSSGNAIKTGQRYDYTQFTAP